MCHLKNYLLIHVCDFYQYGLMCVATVYPDLQLNPDSSQQRENLWSKYHIAPIVGSEINEWRIRENMRFYVFMVELLMITVLCDLNLCSLIEVTDFLEERAASIFRVEE
jgi:hypothetical protein